ncbi:hypothetical protein MA16_Dca015747 [Dendrobium catenatum]|uniref:DUF4219 domain-containing protein n=1 Tax=Dendrobium catenatum TaxID=906689 RepID=A0A2I0WHT4_9ASPA|nr:hypothetical protein MA16_Dca015747 [Dendrobium catenatum]
MFDQGAKLAMGNGCKISFLILPNIWYQSQMPKQMPSPMKNGEKSIFDDVVGDTTTSKLTTTRDNSMSMQLPLLTKMNYVVWAMKMEILMEAQGLWEVVEEGTEDRRKDKSAFAMIGFYLDCSVPKKPPPLLLCAKSVFLSFQIGTRLSAKAVRRWRVYEANRP